MSGSKQPKKKNKLRKAPAPPATAAERSIEEEFADLEREIATIKAMPPEKRGEQAMLLKAMRADWARKAAKRKDTNEFEQRFEEAMQGTMESMVTGEQRIDAKGNLSFRLQGDAVAKNLWPVLQDMLKPLTEAFQFAAPATEGAKETVTEANDAAAGTETGTEGKDS